MLDPEQIKQKVNGYEPEFILPNTPRFTSVLIPLVEADGELHVLFEVRGAGIAQAGEVSFPGGHVEPGETPEQAVIRETCEELLISPHQVEILAPMHRMADRGKLIVDSFLGILHEYQGTYSADEVSRVFTLPLEQLMTTDPDIYNAKTVLVPGDDFPYDSIPGGRDYPFFQFPKHFYFYHATDAVIWGITAELLYHAMQRLKQ